VGALLSARRIAVKAHTAATNRIHALLVTGPAELRERYRRHNTNALITALARYRPAAHDDPTAIAVWSASTSAGGMTWGSSSLPT
jgi:transposase